MLLSIYYGASRIHCDDVKNIIEYIKKYKISFMCAVPSVYKFLYTYIDNIDKENIKMFFCGGAPLEETLQEKYLKNGIILIQGYGMTETSPVISLSDKENFKMGYCGKVIQNFNYKVLKKDEEKIGELILKGDSIFLGYYEDIEMTNKTIKNGWLYTGDIVQIEDDGYIKICGRNKNIIILQNGKKIFPEELENLINNIEGVKESIVLLKKINDKEKLCVKLVCDDSERNKVQKEIEKLNKKLPEYKVMHEIIFSNDETITNIYGKVKRKENIEDELSKEIIGIIAKQISINEEQISINSNLLYDLGVDSLDKVSIILNIKKAFNIEITNEESKKIKNVSDLINCMYNK